MRPFASIPVVATFLLAGASASAQTAAPPWSPASAGAASSAAPTSTPTRSTRRSRPMQKAGKSPDMDVRGGVAPTGPYTTTEDAPPVSDLSGSVGASIGTPAAPPPPGVAPPNGASDTGGADTPNTAGGPH